MNFTRKGYADDSLLQHPTLQSQLFQSTSQKLTDAGITSYSKLLEAVVNDSLEPDIRATAIWTVRTVLDALDKRYVLKPLLKALESPHENVRSAVIFALSPFNDPQVINLLVNFACDSWEAFSVRLSAMQGLYSEITTKQFNRLRAVIFDETDDVRVRCAVLEWLRYPSDLNEVGDYIQLLQHSIPDLRFWAAYRLSQSRSEMSQVVTVLDKVAAFDHHLPATWGWHVDREALEALESAYWLKMGLKRRHSPPSMYLISPAPEYSTFEWRFSEFRDDWFFNKRPEPRITFRVEPNWLAQKLREKWPNIQFDIREPKPQTYLLNWLIKINNSPLMGGLHRDQYAVVITGSAKAVRIFAAWYRSIIEPAQYLYLYKWAGLAVELRPGINAEDVEKAQRQRETNMNALYERSINYPWVIETE